MQSSEDSKEKAPWTELPHIWKNENQYMNYVRSALRKAWMNNPVKLEFIKKYRIKVPNPNPAGRKPEVFGMECSRCCGHFSMHPGAATKNKIEERTGKPLNYIEINHKKPAGVLRTKEDVAEFAANLLFVTFKDIEAVCHKCHQIVTYSQRHGVSEEEAAVELEVIQICKLPALQIKEYIEVAGKMEPGSNATKRRNQVREIVRRNYEQEAGERLPGINDEF